MIELFAGTCIFFTCAKSRLLPNQNSLLVWFNFCGIMLQILINHLIIQAWPVSGQTTPITVKY
jgi:hypothetical protein